VLGKKVELFVVDNKSDKVERPTPSTPDRKEKVVAIIGTYGSSLAMAGAKSRRRPKSMVGTPAPTRW